MSWFAYTGNGDRGTESRKQKAEGTMKSRGAEKDKTRFLSKIKRPTLTFAALSPRGSGILDTQAAWR